MEPVFCSVGLPIDIENVIQVLKLILAGVLGLTHQLNQAPLVYLHLDHTLKLFIVPIMSNFFNVFLLIS